MRKSLLFTFLLAAASVCMAETTPGLTILFKNQAKVSFAFATKPEIAVSAQGITVTSTAPDAVGYTFDEVQRFYFEDDVTDIKSINEDQSAQHPVFSYVNGTVSVSGLVAGEQVSVFSVGGSKVGEAKADNAGCANLDISGTDSGIYVVGTGSGVSFKLLKK